MESQVILKGKWKLLKDDLNVSKLVGRGTLDVDQVCLKVRFECLTRVSLFCGVDRTAFQAEEEAYEKDQKSEKCWHFHGSERISVGIEPGVWKER